MRKTEQLRVPVDPGLKELLRTLASRHGQSLAEFVREAASARAREYLEIDDVGLRREIARRSAIPLPGRSR